MATTAILTEVQRFNPPTEGKHIAYDRQTKDYAMFLDGQYLGHAATYGDAENVIRDVYYEQLTHTQVETADQVADAAEEVARRTWIDEDGTPLESISVEGASFERVVGEQFGTLHWAGHMLEVSSGDLQQLARLLGAA